MAKFYSSTIQKGSQGDEVKKWQQYLNSQGYNLTVDGIFGDNTYNATTDYQTKNGLGADGIVGENTWGKAGYAPKVNYNSSATSAPNVGNAPSKPTFNTTGTSTPNVGSAPTGPTFNTTATTKPNVGSAPTGPTFNTTGTATPESKPLPNAPTYDSTSWDDTTKGQTSLNDYNSAKDAVNNYGDFTYGDYVMGEDASAAKDALDTHNANKPGAYQSGWQTQLDALMNSIMNRDKFSYNMNEDALYQQYKDKYIEQGKLAMADTMGQAAAMTGGYGSSYAQSVGQQAYQGQLNNLNDIVPELYQMALNKYNQEGQDLYNQYGLVMDRENTDYGRYRDSVSDWMNDRGYLQGVYNDERSFDYGKYVDDRNLDYSLHQEGYQRLLDSLGIAKSDYYDGANMHYTEQNNKNSVAGQQFNDAMSLWGAESDEAWKQYQASEEKRQYANSLLQQGHQNEFNAWQADSDNAWKNYQADEEARQYANSLLQQGYQNEFGAWEADSNNAWKEYQANEEARQYANSLLQQGYQNEFGEWQANTDNAWKQAQWDEAARQYANEEAWKQAEWDENNRRYEEGKAASSGNGGNGGNGNGGNTGGATYADTLWNATGTYDDNGNPIFRNSEGKTQAFGKGVNPYTGTKHPDAKHGTFSNGYQPNNIGGTKLKNSGMSTSITGKSQTIWEANGKYWLWRGDLNKYIEVDVSDLG